jgi:hypothetical protein
LFVFIALAHDRRRIVHFNATAHTTAEWTTQQMLETFPFDKAPRYLLRRVFALNGSIPPAFATHHNIINTRENITYYIIKETPLGIERGLKAVNC